MYYSQTYIKKVRQYNSQQYRDKQTNICQQNTTQKTKDWETRTSLKTVMNSGEPEELVNPVSLVVSVVLFLLKY
jgi:hypothetical protein